MGFERRERHMTATAFQLNWVGGFLAAFALASFASAKPPPEDDHRRSDPPPADRQSDSEQDDADDPDSAKAEPSDADATPEDRPHVRGERPRPRGDRPEPGDDRPDGPRPPRGSRRPGPPGDPDDMRRGDGPPGDGFGGPFRRGNAPPRRLSAEQIDEIMTLVKELMPVRHERLSILRKRNPEFFQRQIHQLAPVMFRIQESEGEMKELLIKDMQLDTDMRDTCDKLRKAQRPNVRDELTRELRGYVEQQFDVKQRKQKYMIAEFEKRLAEQKRHHEDREKNREKLVESRLKELTSDDPPLRWPD